MEHKPEEGAAPIPLPSQSLLQVGEVGGVGWGGAPYGGNEGKAVCMRVFLACRGASTAARALSLFT